MMLPRGTIAVVGPSQASPDEFATAHEVGTGLARLGATVLTGGLGGVMEAASRGADENGGTTLAFLPGASTREANPYVQIPIATAMGEMRNTLIVRAADALVAVGGSWGTLSEIALACKTGVPVFAIGSWPLPHDGPVPVKSAGEALEMVDRLLPGRHRGGL